MLFFSTPRTVLARSQLVSHERAKPGLEGTAIPPVQFAFKDFSNLLPLRNLHGLCYNHQGHPASLLGDFRSSGWWYYFPTALLLKTSLPFLLLTVAAVRWAFWAALSRREKLLVPIFAFAALYFGMAMTSRINIGVRHIAPVFPFLFLLGGIFLDRFLRTRA